MANSITKKDDQVSAHMGAANDKLKKAQDAGSQALDKTKDAAAAAGEALVESADAGAAAVGGGIKTLAGTIRDKGPHEGMLGDATSTLAQGLEAGGRYLQKEGVSGMADDITEMIKRNPIPAVLVGVGIGFMLAQLTSRS